MSTVCLACGRYDCSHLFAASARAQQGTPAPECPVWEDGRHYFFLQYTVNLDTNTADNEHKRCACGATVRRKDTTK